MAEKRLALFLDGTWNDVEDNTNVWRLRSLVADRSADDRQQRIFYSKGVGTAKGENFRGGALGYGLSENVIAAYRWLIENYDPGDELFFFGFSRGAFTARSIAGLIAKYGLLRPGAPLSVGQVYDRYRQHKKSRWLWQIQKSRDRTPDEQRLLENTRRVMIKMIGVWDTVGALGVPFGRLRGLSRPSFNFHNTDISGRYRNSYHALAIDEHREAFRESLWTRFTSWRPGNPASPPLKHMTIEQRWFVGAHANVGGGIPDDDLPQVPLAWMMAKAEALGLAFRFPVPLKGDEHLGPIADSYAAFLHGLYPVLKGFRRYHRVIAAPAAKVERGYSQSINETIDATVFDRWRRDPTYRPPSLDDWAKRKRVDPAGFAGAANAATGAEFD